MADTTTENPSQAVEQHARSYFDAIARRDVEAIGGHWSEDGVEDLVPIGILRGRQGVKDFFSGLFAAMPDIETTLVRILAGERSAAVEWRMAGTFTGEPFQGIDATGKSIEVRGLDLMEIEDGRLVSNAAYFDQMDFARQLGMMPPMDSGAERAMKSAFNAVTKARRAISERTSR